jgi:hypothetical protein
VPIAGWIEDSKDPYVSKNPKMRALAKIYDWPNAEYKETWSLRASATHFNNGMPNDLRKRLQKCINGKVVSQLVGDMLPYKVILKESERDFFLGFRYPHKIAFISNLKDNLNRVPILKEEFKEDVSEKLEVFGRIFSTYEEVFYSEVRPQLRKYYVNRLAEWHLNDDFFSDLVAQIWEEKSKKNELVEEVKIEEPPSIHELKAKLLGEDLEETKLPKVTYLKSVRKDEFWNWHNYPEDYKEHYNPWKKYFEALQSFVGWHTYRMNLINTGQMDLWEDLKRHCSRVKPQMLMEEIAKLAYDQYMKPTSLFEDSESEGGDPWALFQED